MYSKVEFLTTSTYLPRMYTHENWRAAVEPMNRRRALRFDKAFPVYLIGDQGLSRGIARNISEGGMFIETRDPFPLGSRIKVTFTSEADGAELTVLGEVRYQCFLSYGEALGGEAKALKGMGVRFVEFEQEAEPLLAPGGASRARTLH